MRAGQFGIQGQVSTSRAWRCFATRRYKTVVYTVDVVLSLAFLVDFTVRLHLSASTPHSFRDFGRADLLARLPLPQARVLRISAWSGQQQLRRYQARSIARPLFSKPGAGNALWMPCGPSCSSACWSWRSGSVRGECFVVDVAGFVGAGAEGASVDGEQRDGHAVSEQAGLDALAVADLVG